MPDAPTLAAFLTASILITVAPGPDNLMVLAHSIARGWRAGLALALGCTLGCLTHILWATLGLSAALAASPGAFVLLTVAGALWLAWLGIAALRSRTPPPEAVEPPAAAPTTAVAPARDLMKGFVANAINPKVALFFLAFLPQFLNPEAGHVALQSLVLGALFMAQTIIVFGLIALAAGTLGRQLSRHPAWARGLDRFAGLVFLALALRLLATLVP